MEKNIKNYLHLYIGCEAKMPGATVVVSHALLADEHAMKHYGIRPTIRNLLNMTEPEIREYASCYGVKASDTVPCSVFKNPAGHIQISIGHDYHCASLFPLSGYGNSPESFRYLLSKHFDLFNLINDNLAIDAATI